MASGASIIQDLPQVEVRKVTAVDDFAMKGQWEELCKAYKEMLVRDKMLKSLELVYGQPGMNIVCTCMTFLICGCNVKISK